MAQRKLLVAAVTTGALALASFPTYSWTQGKRLTRDQYSAAAEFESGSTRTRLILALDGTSDKPYDDGQHPTSNVMRIARGVKPVADDGVAQIVRYNWGVGTEEEGWINQQAASATGDGLDDDIMENYRFLALNYAPNVDIFLIGFSRGAFTALSLAGMIDKIGLLSSNNVTGNKVGEAFDAYKKHKEEPEAVAKFRKEHNTIDVPIKFLGVFDIVAALSVQDKGVESDGYVMTLFRKAQEIVSSSLGMMTTGDSALNRDHVDYCPSNVEHAFHAVSIDEDRRPFKPNLLDNDTNQCGNLTEVWFPGCHSDVGGGYKERHLSNHVLRIMAKHMEDHGVTFFQDYGTDPQNEDGKATFHRESNWPANLRKPRDIPPHAKFDGKVVQLLNTDDMYKSYCNPNLRNVSDPQISSTFKKYKHVEP